MKFKHYFKRLKDGFNAISLSKELISHDQWTRQQLEEFQQKQLSLLVRHAVENSPFYKDFYHNLNLDDPIQLDQLPILGKKTMMKNFDRFVTEPRLKLRALEAHLSQLSYDDYYLGKYRVLSSGGSSGRFGVFVFDRREWSTVLATIFRARSFSGGSAFQFPHRPKIGVISPVHPRHATTRLNFSGDVGFNVFQNLSLFEPIKDIVKKLNAFQPETFGAYPSMASLLAIEQLEGRLKIHPEFVYTTGELCTKDMRQRIEKAWGVKPYNNYAMTELIGFGMNCDHFKGLHASEDLAILEVVDEHNRPVPDGTLGHKILITNLYNFTQPLIRYEVSDMLMMSEEPCPCGRPFRLIARIEGRMEDIVELDGFTGENISVHPAVFENLIGSFHQLKEYQVLFEDGDIHLNFVLFNQKGKDILAQEIENKLKETLKSLNAKCPPIYSHFLEQLPRNPERLGKAKLVNIIRKTN